jgi:hypothetical protein
MLALLLSAAQHCSGSAAAATACMRHLRTCFLHDDAGYDVFVWLVQACEPFHAALKASRGPLTDLHVQQQQRQ